VQSEKISVIILIIFKYVYNKKSCTKQGENKMSSDSHLVVVEIKLSKVKPYRGQPRTEFDQLALERLAQSIQNDGLKNPIRVCKNPDENGTFILIGGERRTKALQMIWERTGTEPVVPAIVDMSVTPKNHFREALVDNLHREDITPLEEAAAVAKLKNEYNMPVAEIATLIGKSVPHIYGRLALDTLPEKVKTWLRDGSLSVSAAVEVAKSTRDEYERIRLAQEIVERGLGLISTKILLGTAESKPSSKAQREAKRRHFQSFRAFLKRTLEYLESYNVQELVSGYDESSDEENLREGDLLTLRRLVEGFENLKEPVGTTFRQRIRGGVQ
jgi:ParB family transcriptional regulator, chromosome partitioning protein